MQPLCNFYAYLVILDYLINCRANGHRNEDQSCRQSLATVRRGSRGEHKGSAARKNNAIWKHREYGEPLMRVIRAIVRAAIAAAAIRAATRRRFTELVINRQLLAVEHS